MDPRELSNEELLRQFQLLVATQTALAISKLVTLNKVRKVDRRKAQTELSLEQIQELLPVDQQEAFTLLHREVLRRMS